MVKFSFPVVQAEKERTNSAALFCVAESSDYGIGGANALDFHYAAPLAGIIGIIETLGDDAVEAELAEFAHPLFGLGAIARGGREAHISVAQNAFKKFLQLCVASGQRLAIQPVALFVDQQVKADVSGRRIESQAANSGGGGMNSHQQAVERKTVAVVDNDLAIKQEL